MKGLEAGEFEARKFDDKQLSDRTKFSETTQEDIERIELLLDVRSGVLGAGPYYFSVAVCPNKHRLTMFDFVFTALVDAGHSKSFILHALVGNKRFVNPSRKVRCSTCAAVTEKGAYYAMRAYQCERE